MNSYRHYIADFNDSTRHLSLIERGVYYDLLFMYYRQETAIDGTDMAKLQRQLCVCLTDEKQALDNVLFEFFENRDGFYFNNRCESEIKKYRDRLESAIQPCIRDQDSKMLSERRAK